MLMSLLGLATNYLLVALENQLTVGKAGPARY
jgi:hypothetical protein